MNMLVSEEFGQYFARLPLKKAAKIVHGNALRIDWNTLTNTSNLEVSANKMNIFQVHEPIAHYDTLNVYTKEININKRILPARDTKWENNSNGKVNYIIGNPPFIGERYQSKEQREDLELVFDKKIKLDYVAAWYYKAAKYVLNTTTKVGFVSTNSIMQGEQVVLLWKPILLDLKCKIHFAHTTFKWNNEAKGKAAVFCTIVGFANFDTKNKMLFSYEDINGEPTEIKVKNLNPYLVNADTAFIERISKPVCDVETLQRGSDANDRGNLLFTEDQKNEFIKLEPRSKKFFRRTYGAKEFINNIKRYTLWLENIDPSELRTLRYVIERVQNIKEFRDNPHLFGSIRKPKNDYLFIPQMSSSNRKYIPIGFLKKGTIPLGPHFFIDKANLYYFGVLTSKIHMTWVKYTCGRLKSDYRYSNSIVYNNYPWPKNPSEKNKKKVEEKAQKVLDIRATFPESSLADLYHALTMPPKLVKAHQELDKAVDLCYRPQAFTNEITRIEYLFDLYNQYTAPLLNLKKTKKKNNTLQP
jgi:hypothetical protein